MPAAAPYVEESKRLNALRRLNILDTPAEDAYNDIVKLAAELCETPIGVISLVDEDRQWFKATFGLDVQETPRCQAFCAHAIHFPTEPLVVADATQDPRFIDNPLVTNEPRIRFYAGVPLVSPGDEMPIGTLCVISDQVKQIDERQLAGLSTLASLAEKLLQLRESTLQVAQRDAMIDASNDAVISWSVEDGIQSWNRGAENLYGYKREEVVGEMPEEIFRVPSAEIRRVIAGLKVGDDWVGDSVQQNRVGDVFPVSTRVQRFGVGQTSVFLETSRDLTGQKKSQRALQRAQRALDTAADAVLWVRPTGEIFYVNNAACERLQYTPEEMLQMRVDQINTHIPSAEDFQENYWRRIKADGYAVFESVHRRKDGSTIAVEIATHLIEFENEEFTCSFVRDIRDRISSRKKLEELSSELQLIFEALPLGVVYKDQQRRITRVNPAFMRIFGYAEKDVLGQPADLMYSERPGDSGSILPADDGRDEAGAFTREIEYRRRSGDTFLGETVGTAVQSSDGDVVGQVMLIQDVSERVAARKQLDLLNEDRRAMVELLGTTDGVWSWLPGSEVCEYAPGFRKLLGFAGDDTIGFPETLEAFDTRIHPEDRDGLWAAANQALSARESFSHEFRLRRADDNYIWVRSRANAIYDEAGMAVRMVGSSHDVTDMKLAETERDRFFDAGIQLYAIVDVASGQWVRLSPNWTEVLGYSIDELLNMTLLDLACADDRPSVDERVTQLENGEAVRSFPLRMRHADGSFRWIEWNASPPENGETSVYATASDVTDGDHDVVRKIADAVPMTLYIYDIVRKKNTFVNRHVGDLLGYSSAEILEFGDEFLPKLAHPRDWSRIQDHFDEIRQGADDDCFDIEYRMLHSDGDYRRIYSTKRIFKRSPDGVVQQIIGTATLLDDLTTLRRYAADLETANDELEQFAYVASHDLKQPLRGIDNLAKWITEDCGDALPDQGQRHLTRLRGRVTRMERLLDDLLSYSRIGRRNMPPEDVDVKELVLEVAELLDPPAEFRIECIGEMPTITTERVAFEQVLRNLIGNAIKHRVRDDGTVTISARPMVNFVEFSVSDDGPGVAPEFHDRIFRMFQTLRPRDDMEASGVGLALAKKQVEIRRGRIGIVSDASPGATFQFTWPDAPLGSGA